MAPASDVPARRARVRSPVDVLRLIVGALLVLVGVATANLFDTALLGLSDDGSEAIDDLPSWARDVPAAALGVALVVVIAGALLASLVTTRYRRLAMIGLGVVTAATLSVLIGELVHSLVDPDVQRALDDASAPFRFRRSGGGLSPGDPLLAGAVATLGITGSFVSRQVTRRLAWVVSVYALVSVVTSGVPAVGLMADVGAGLLAASVVLLVFGRHDLSPTDGEVTAALAAIGIELSGIEQSIARTGAYDPWTGTTVDGERVFVKAFGRDERSADLLMRAGRWIRFRQTGDHRPFVSLRRAVEHEALVVLQAAALGVDTPRLLGVASAGLDGMVLAFEDLEGVRADELELLDDETLTAVWSMVRTLQDKRIAHRDLRLANVVIDSRGAPSLTGFGYSELAASDQLLATDLAELLASTAAQVGPERAVDAARAAIDPDRLGRVMPWLQPLALSGATREAIGGDDGLDPIRTVLSERGGVLPEEPVQLERISGTTLFMIVTIGLSAWFLIPQLADIDNIWEQTRGASGVWVLAAVGFSIVSYLAATTSLLGAIPVRLRYWPALTAQIASSFANRITPAKVGGFATNVRYFQRQGVPTAVSVTAVGLNAVAGVIVHVLLTLGFLLLASGNRSARGLSVPSTGVIVIALAVLVGVGAASALLPFVRRLFVTHVMPQLRSGWESVQTIGHSPARLVALFGGSAAITLSYLGAMVVSLEAFGSSAPFPLVAVLFLTGTAVSNAAPTPGGLGAAEAALIAALSTVEDTEIVIPAVFLFRLVTFWLPILPGWAALTYLRRTDRI